MKFIEKLNLILGFIIIIMIVAFSIYFIFFKENIINESIAKRKTLSEINNYDTDIETNISSGEGVIGSKILDTNTTYEDFEFIFNAGKNALPENVSLNIKEGTLTESGATLVIEDKNEHPFCYDYNYSIEKRESRTWRTIGNYYDVNESAFCREDGIYEIKTDWSKVCGKLEKGEYRISKSEASKRNQFYVEFEIK